jgi:hypothetical protein
MGAVSLARFRRSFGLAFENDPSTGAWREVGKHSILFFGIIFGMLAIFIGEIVASMSYIFV